MIPAGIGNRPHLKPRRLSPAQTTRTTAVIATVHSEAKRYHFTGRPPVTVKGTTYLDPATGTTRSVVSSTGDQVTYWIQTSVSGNEDQWRTTYVDYTNHTWWTKDSHSAPLGNDTSNVLVLSAQTRPAQISKALAPGQLRVGLKGDVNGHAAIELVYAGQLAGKAGAVRYWVDAATYQPIQIELPPFTAASTVTESWLAKTPATAARTDKPRIPAGFRQVPPSARSTNHEQAPPPLAPSRPAPDRSHGAGGDSGTRC